MGWMSTASGTDPAWSGSDPVCPAAASQAEGAALWQRFRALPAGLPQVLLWQPPAAGRGVAGDPTSPSPAGGPGIAADRMYLAQEPAAIWRVAFDAVEGAFASLDRFAAAHRADRLFGWLGYDLRDAVEPLPRRLTGGPGAPAAWLGAFSRWAEAHPAWPDEPRGVPAAEDLCFALDAAEYQRRVSQVVEHIRAGDIFQANLTQPFRGTWQGDPRDLFQRLCLVSPAPFSAYADDGRGTVVLSSSMEEFLWREEGMVRTQPIKGTRGRDPDPQQDAAILTELRAAPKDQAELAMIVDLMRNDLGRVARVGSVGVAQGFPESATYAQVHHLHHTITAQLRDGTSHGDLLKATWPPGSCTGAPKLRCMELLEELEVARRGVYTGSVGWLGPGDSMHLNVAIRTLTLRLRSDGLWDVWGNVGGGITADSDPEAEWQEIVTKARGMGLALGASPEEPE